MDKIGETIGILNINWDGTTKTHNRSIIINAKPEFVAKDESCTKARIIYAMLIIAAKLNGCDDLAAERKRSMITKRT